MGKPRHTGEGWGWRHAQTSLIVCCVTSAITMRFCLSVAVVAMTGHGEGTFNWEGTKKSAVLGSFLWGYSSTQVLGGALSSRGSATRWMTASVCLSGVLTVLVPPVALATGEHSWIALCVLRVATGFVQGTIFPSSYTLIGRWAPPLERARMGTFVFAAQPCGIIIAMALSGLLASTWGWPAIFYFFGVLSVVVAVLFCALSADSPELHPYISSAERDYIARSIRDRLAPDKLAIPWRALLTSVPMWASVVAHMGYLTGYWVTATCTPTFIENLMPNLDLSINGVVSALPYVLMFVLSISFGWLGDLIEKKQWVSLSVNRKICNSIGNWVPALLLVVIALLGTSSPAASITILIIAVAFLGAIYSGSLMNPVDLSPNFGGVVFGVSNMIGSLWSAFAPFLEGVFVDKKDPIPGWSTVFFITAGAHVLFNLVWLVWGSARVQPWNQPAVLANGDDVAACSVIDQGQKQAPKP